MEFNEKLKELRKQKDLTQEELAEALFVSRTAISKWESGRGYPSLDSLKEIAKFFEITVDELLSGEELLTLAEEDNKQKERLFIDLVFGLLDAFLSTLFFLPLFAERTGDAVRGVSLLVLTGVSSYIRTLYIVFVLLSTALGILTLALQNSQNAFWLKSKTRLSLGLNALGVVLLIITLQPYAAVFLFLFLAVKILILIKNQ